eukprot:553690_1
MTDDIRAIFRDEAVTTSYVRQALSEIPIAIAYAKKLYLPLGGIFSSGRLEAQWDFNKAHTRLHTANFKNINSEKRTGKDQLTHNVRSTIEPFFTVPFWNLLTDDKQQLLEFCMTDEEKKEFYKFVDEKVEDEEDEEKDEEKQFVFNIIDGGCDNGNDSDESIMENKDNDAENMDTENMDRENMDRENMDRENMDRENMDRENMDREN